MKETKGNRSHWERAQKFEPQHWIKNKKAICHPVYRDKIKLRAERLKNLLSKYVNCSSPNLRILEIGGGGTQLTDFFPTRFKYALDPLADMYCREFGEVLNRDVVWSKGKAETLCFADQTFDLIVTRNVLDHVESLDLVLAEIHRVLKPQGRIYAAVNNFSGPLYWFRSLVKDKEHPYTFSHAALEKYLCNAGFKILEALRDAPDQMEHFGKMDSQSVLRKLIRGVFLQMGCYHFSEFIVSK
ncbi:MAG: class I SAM-dependent methyltransferase [Waddliaceae bacterium]